MEFLYYFFECYFYLSFGFDDLDSIIAEFKQLEKKECFLKFIQELHLIKTKKLYAEASEIMRKAGWRILNLEETEGLINYIYNKLLDIPTEVKATDFAGKFDEKDLLEWDLSLPTDAVTYFFETYFNRVHHYEDLDDSIENFKKMTQKKDVEEIIEQLNDIIIKNNYKKVLKLIKKYNTRRKPSLKKTAKLVKFLYDRFNNIPTEVQPADFKGR